MGAINTIRLMSYSKQRPLFTAAEAKRAGISYRQLAQDDERGVIERVAGGLYRNLVVPPDDMHDELALAALTIPEGIICMISALDLYELTDEIPREHWIAIPHSRRARKHPNLRSVRMRNTTLGKTTTKLGRYTVPIFDRERCIVDAFRYLSPEIAIKALQMYLRSGPDLRTLQHYAKRLRVNLQPYILALTT